MDLTNQRLLAAVVNASRDAIWSWDADAIITSWNAEAERLFGYSAAEIVGTSLFMLIPEERRQLAREAVGRLRRGDFYGQYETVRVRKDGIRIDVELTVSPVRDDAGAIVGAATVCRDITQRKAVETRLNLALRAAQLGIWDWNLLTNEMVYSDRAKEIYGFDPACGVTFEQVRDATHPDDLPRTQELSRRARDPSIRDRTPYEFRIIRPDGSIRWVSAHGETVFARVGGAEKAVRYAGTIQDITERKRVADALVQSERRLRLAVEAGKMGIWEYDPATERLIGSPELNRVLGFPPGGSPTVTEIRSGYLPGEQDRLREAARRALAAGEQSFQVEFRYRSPDQTVHWLMLRAEFVVDDGKVSRLIGIVTDVSDFKRALEQQEVLVNEVNHRVRNTLATVQSLASMTLKTKSPSEFATSFSRRLTALSATHDLLTRSGWEHALLEDVVRVELSPFMSDRIALDTTCRPILLKPKAALSLGLVFHELATNAAKYGALSKASGQVGVRWQIRGGSGTAYLSIEWRETGGPLVKPPRKAGFGSRLIETSITKELEGDIRLHYPPSGVCAEMELRLEAIIA